MIINDRISQFMKFVFVGGLATSIHYTIYYGLEYIGINYNISYSLGYFISFIFNYYASNFFTFKTAPTTRKGIRFALAHGINYVLQIGLLNLYILVGINSKIAPLFVFIITVPTNYFVVKYALKEEIHKES